jgi:hypothetical protein
MTNPDDWRKFQIWDSVGIAIPWSDDPFAAIRNRMDRMRLQLAINRDNRLTQDELTAYLSVGN